MQILRLIHYQNRLDLSACPLVLVEGGLDQEVEQVLVDNY